MKKRALVLIGHGSRQPYNIEVVGEIAGKIRAREAWGVVSYCFNEMNEPSVADALDDICKDDEVTTIVFAPVFISSGRHVIEDIPRALGLPKG
ncbi:MAG: sirohydrochlorin nickelochelatase, partial [Candidatus Methanofastidiosa archaeon]|nr:sirohydrochlorin nickelochelatase [Candidatus Methanofastidiosa archaeon]